MGPQVGELDERGVLRHHGRVEFGVTEDVVAALHERLGPLVRRTSPFGQRLNEPDATYLEPRLPAEIRYLERTSEGRLRHAAFRQLGGRWNH